MITTNEFEAYPEEEIIYRLDLFKEIESILPVSSKLLAVGEEVLRRIFPYLGSYDGRHEMLLRSGVAHAILAKRLGRKTYGETSTEQLVALTNQLNRLNNNKIPSHWAKALQDSVKPPDIDFVLSLGINVPMETIRWALGFEEASGVQSLLFHGVELIWERRQTSSDHVYITLKDGRESMVLDIYEIPSNEAVERDGRLGLGALKWDFFSVGEVSSRNGRFTVDFDQATIEEFSRQNTFVTRPREFSLKALVFRLMLSNYVAPVGGIEPTTVDELIDSQSLDMVRRLIKTSKRNSKNLRQDQKLKDALRLCTLNPHLMLIAYILLGFVPEIPENDISEVILEMSYDETIPGPIRAFNAIESYAKRHHKLRFWRRLHRHETTILNTLEFFDR